jgi:DNA repair exonuclease SbcCD ATPase subunit
LQPGDVIKLFGRVEDNDPAGAKGAESAVATVRIISEEEFEQMLRVQKGIEALMSKYEAARRRLEKMAGEIEDLEKKIKNLPPGDPVTEETREELHKLQNSMREQAEEIAKLSQQKLPFDADKNFAAQLDKVVQMTKDMAKELEKLEQLKDLSNNKLADKLNNMAQQLSSRRKSFQEQISMPLEKLEAVFRLLVDEQRFIALAQWQRDLAERLSSLKGRDNEDNPALKARCREMEQEQRQIQEALDALLNDIDDHVQRLPNDVDLAELRQTAANFVKDVRASGAAEAMAEAESALTEFAVTRGYEKAKLSADILDKFIKKCDGNCPLQGNCQGHIFFQPELGNGMGITLGQLLGWGNGGGSGMGGYSAVGLYGGLPTLGGMDGRQGVDRAGFLIQSARAIGTVPAANPDASTSRENNNAGNAAGASEGEVPMQYRREVGKYFQRIAEETGEVHP